MMKIIGILAGHFLFALSGASYSLFWIWNDSYIVNSNQKAAGIFIAVSFVAGILALFFLISSTSFLSQSAEEGKLKLIYIVIFSVLFFILSLIITTAFFHRMITSELFLVMLWFAIEACVITVLNQNNLLSNTQSILSYIMVIIALAVSLYCYTVHYILDGFARFINGLIPYLAISVIMLIIGVLLIIHNSGNSGIGNK
jgi:hypothetical protein